jgi:Glycosyl transferase family 90
MMPQPRFTSWAMEELLQPWVHYIPLDDDLSDAQDKTQWILDHDDAARKIAHQGSLWIRDLVLHPDSKSDDEAITREIIQRYIAHFQIDNK